MSCYRTDENGRCDCGGRPDGGCFEQPSPKPTGRLRGGLSRIARALDLDSPAGIFWNLTGAAIGVGAGWLFAAMWMR